jgi:hypothetical protein
LNLLPGYPLHTFILLSTPDTFEDRVRQIVAQMKFPPALAVEVMNTFENRYGVDPRSLSVSAYVSKLNPVKALVLHDIHDKVLPIEWSRNVASQLRNCELAELSGTGHYRILRDQQTQGILYRELTNSGTR